MEKLSDELGLARSKKEGLRRALDLVQAQANTVMLFGLQWQDLEEHFDSISKAIGERLEQLGARERSVEERFAEVASKEREVEKKAEEFEREVLMREERLALLEKRLEDCSRECKEREDRLASATDYLAECLQETEVKEKELISVRDSIEGSRRELGMKKQYLQDSLKTCCAELDSKKMELDKIRKSVAECRVDLDLKWRQLGSIKTLIDECNEELTSKKKSLDAVQKSVAACSAEFDSKKSELALLEESVRDLKVEDRRRIQKCSRLCPDEIGLKKELESAKALLVEREAELKSREEQFEASQKELALARAERDECLSEIQSARASFEERSRILEVKERQLQGQLMGLKTQQERLHSLQKSLEEKRAEVELREGVNVVLVQQKLLDTIQLSLDPAKLVLQALQEVDSLCARKNVRRVSKRSCLLLLRYLGEASLEIKPKVKEAAMALASQWKAQLSASSPHYVFGVLALFKLIVVYELTPAFCLNELEDLVNSIAHHGETNELRMLLGLSGPLPSPKVILLNQAGKKLAQISPKVEDCSQVQHTYKRSRVA
ncbi:protein CROWDED NUCLEI 4-like [Punica granatum]|nr:protein CROWDED NUCLEI 4-like [Punica granatum]